MGRLDWDSDGRADVPIHRRWPKEGHLTVQHQKVQTLESDVELLLETLSELTQSDLETFKMVLVKERLGFKLHSDIQHRLLLEADLQNTVLIMVEICGLQSVKITKNILMKMKKTNLVEKLSSTSSTSKERNLDKLAALIHKVASMVAAKDLISEILMALIPKQFKILKWFLQSTFFHMGLPQLPWSQLVLADRVEIVDQLVRLCGRQSVEVAAEVLTDMNIYDLALRLSEGYPRQKEKQEEPWPELDKEVEVLKSEISYVLNGLAALKNHELENLKDEVLHQISCVKHSLNFHWEPVKMADLLDMTLLLVQTYGSGFKNKISGVLEKMKLSLCCEPVTSSPERQVNKQQTALIHKVATVSALKQLLVRTITGLSDEELQEFKTLLLSKSGGSLSQVLLRLIHKFDGAEIVDVMIDQLGQQSVEVTRQILIDLKRTDLLQRLPESSSEREENLFVGKQAAASVKREEDFSKILLETLVDFDLRDLDKFRWLLQFTCFRRSVPQIPKDQLEYANSPHRLIHLMVERLGQRSLEVAREVLTDMNRRDLLKKLPETSAESKDFSLLLKSEANMKPDVKKLLEALQHLSHMELDHFKEILQKKVWSCGFRLVLRHQDEMVERLKVAEVMVQLLEKQSLQLAMDILEEIKRTDLQKMLFSSCSASETTPSAHPESGGHIQKDSSEWTRLEPKIMDENETPTYSLESAAGQFECSVSGLRWVCKDKIGFKYQFCSWQGHMERMKTRGLRCAGPLIDITVTTGKINEVYLPHWICIDDIPSLLENFSVLHINDSGDVLEKVFQVTATHVRLTEPVFSPLAALINSIFRVKVACNLLIYYKPHTPFLKLHVYLILQDPALQQ
ncbi:hypothetical protein ATANTOWER_000885, partial [Ataeniobius toweri]|nr:hypothetical protein [Ataeniobius toweri]